jgi:hypothetical protein
MAKIQEQVVALGIKTTILKGWAVYCHERACGYEAARIPGDIDLLADSPAEADQLRRRLIESGFEGDPIAPRTGPHHLAPVLYRGIPVEIHTRIMPKFWRLPERQMIQARIPAPGLPGLFTLSPEGMIFHEVIHSATHLFAYGVKCALDVMRIQRLFNTIEWDTVAQFAWMSGCPRAFWAPFRSLVNGLEGLMPIPDSIMSQAPDDSRQRRIEMLATRRLFTATENPDEMNPFTRNGIFLWMFDGIAPRIRYVAGLFDKETAESRRSALSRPGGQNVTQLKQHLRRAAADWRSYRELASRTR